MITSRVIIADATCLILLSKIDLLSVLHDLFEDIRVTPEVAAEFGDPIPGWIVVEHAPAAPHITFDSRLGSGECSSILLAVHHNSSIILDDLRARNFAKQLGLTVIGTLGILLHANFRLSEEVITSFLRSANE